MGWVRVNAKFWRWPDHGTAVQRAGMWYASRDGCSADIWPIVGPFKARDAVCKAFEKALAKWKAEGRR